MKICPLCHTGSGGVEPRCPECGGELGAVSSVDGTELAGMLVAGRYRLEECVGEGAMGWVYRGTHLVLGSAVAVKIMKPVGADGTRMARFETEARAASRISHPHVLMIHDFGRTGGGLLYIISEFLTGETLGQLIKREPYLPLGRVVTLFNQVLAAVEEAHGHKLIHRDLKPDNIMVTRLRSGEDFVKVLDFGIARIAEAGEARITMQGEICGTPAFMAPEQIRGQEASELSDLYALCLVLYELLTGRPAFQVDSVMEMLAMQLHSKPLALREAAPDRDLPRALEAVLDRGLSKDPRERFQSVAELRSALFAALGDSEASQVPCRGCHQPHPPWSTRCVGCGIAGTASRLPALDVGAEAFGSAEPPAPADQRAGTARHLAVAPSTGAQPREKGYSSRLASAHTLPSLVGERAGRLPRVAGAPEIPRPSDDWSDVFGSVPVGREAQLAEAEQFLDGSRVSLEILAPVGMGKTTLLEAIANRAAARGLTVLRAAADPSLSRQPFYAVAALVAQRLSLPPEREAPPSLVELRRAALQSGLAVEDLPGLADLFGMVTTQRAARSVRLRELQAASLRALLGPIGASACILIDDADELDGASLGLIRRLCEAIPAGATHVVLASEASILPGDGPQRSIYLEPLSPASMGVLAKSLPLGRGLPSQALSALVASAHGSPLYASQALHLAAAGLSLPEGDLDALVRLRMEGLTGPALEALEAICLAGNRAQVDLLGEVLGASRVVRPSLEELVRQGFLGPRIDETASVAHPRIAEVVRESLSAQRGAAMHRRIFRALEARGSSLLGLARHARDARLGEETLDLLFQAGDLAAQWLDDEGAALHFRSALLVLRWELLVGEEDERFLLASLKLGDALTGAGHYLAAEMTYKEALASSGRHALLGLRLHLSFARLLARRGLHDEARVVLQEALRKGLEAGAPDLLLDLYLDLAEVFLALGWNAQAETELDEALLVLTQGEGPAALGVPSAFWRLLLRLGELRASSQGAAAAAPLAQQALVQARRARDLEGEALSLLATVRFLGPDSPRAELERLVGEAIATFQRLGDRRGVAECLLVKARRFAPDRRPTVERALALASQVGWTEGVAEARQILSQAA